MFLATFYSTYRKNLIGTDIKKIIVIVKSIKYIRVVIKLLCESRKSIMGFNT